MILIASFIGGHYLASRLCTLFGRESSVVIATGPRAGRPRNRGSIPGKGISLLHSSDTGTGAHPTFCRVGTGEGCLPGGKAAGT
jgi:hypothetical protein